MESWAGEVLGCAMVFLVVGGSNIYSMLFSFVMPLIFVMFVVFLVVSMGAGAGFCGVWF